MFTDDQKRLEALQRLNQRHAALLERRRELEKRAEKGEEQLREAHAAMEQVRKPNPNPNPNASPNLSLILSSAQP